MKLLPVLLIGILIPLTACRDKYNVNDDIIATTPASLLKERGEDQDNGTKVSVLKMPATCLVYDKADSIKIEKLLADFFSTRQQDTASKEKSNAMIWFARQLIGIPYVAQTLEKNKTEKLVVNTRELDCTTYTETVLALSQCAMNNALSFEDYCNRLQQIRYRGGNISYVDRLHYFTDWIIDNQDSGMVEEIQSPAPPFSSPTPIKVYYMSTYSDKYPMLKDHPEWVEKIAEAEKRLSRLSFRYIPKSAIRNTQVMRNAIHDGDILAITTSKKGLDTSHIGIAVWHDDGLHLLNASQIHMKVVEEPMTLAQYMQKHPTQTGIRVIRPLFR